MPFNKTITTGSKFVGHAFCVVMLSACAVTESRTTPAEQGSNPATSMPASANAGSTIQSTEISNAGRSTQVEQQRLINEINTDGREFKPLTFLTRVQVLRIFRATTWFPLTTNKLTCAWC